MSIAIIRSITALRGGSMAMKNAEDYYTKQEADTQMGGKHPLMDQGANVPDVATDLDASLGGLNILNVHTHINTDRNRINSVAQTLNTLIARLEENGLLAP